MEARNRTSHIYNAELAQEVYDVAKKFAGLARSLLKTLKTL